MAQDHQSAAVATHPAGADIRIGPLTNLEQMDAAVALQKTIWGGDHSASESRLMLVIAREFIGQLLGAFDGDRVVGIALAFFTRDPRCMHSHRVGLLPEYQNRGIGRRLKLAQREACLRSGAQVLQWSFDPLQARNAHFNITQLGAVATRYLPNLYGVTSSPLHAGLPTDRLLVEWRLDSPRVKEALAGEHSPLQSQGPCIEIPLAGQPRSLELQTRVRNEFLHWFERGYVVTAFERTGTAARYLLEKQ